MKVINMDKQAADQSKRQKSFVFDPTLFKLTIGGGAVFWVTSIVTSLLPIAAEYRAAFSNWSVETVWFGSLLMGMMIGCGVSFSLLRFYGKIPAKGPILKAVIVSSVALVIAIILIDVPMILHKPGALLYYFLIGVLFNAARFLLLGFSVGYLYKRIRWY